MADIKVMEPKKIPRKTIINSFPDGGEIRSEVGSDGTYIVFDCECLDAIDLCKAACCSMPGTFVMDDEIPALNEVAERIGMGILIQQPNGKVAMKRDADGTCVCLDRDTRQCSIYDDRPKVCRHFHCSKGVSRGQLMVHQRQKEFNN